MTAGSARSRTARHRQRLTALLVSAVVLFGAGAAQAQVVAATAASGTTVGGSVGPAALWDDETRLGSGVALTGEVSTPLGPHLRTGVEGGWVRHSRNSGYLAANGHVLHLMGRAELFLAPRTWAVRPFVGLAVGLARSTGTLFFQTVTAPGGGRTTTTRQPWTHTAPAWHVHVGTRITTGSRLVLRPELSVGAIGTSDTPGALELPLLRLQAGVAVEWRLGASDQ